MLDEVLPAMAPISLEEMNSVKLMNRTDTKYLLNRRILDSLAEHWSSSFYVQEVSGSRIAHYRTLYFDTSDAMTYTIHHNQHLHRQKIRQREYVDTGTVFCEVKNKVNTGRTKKKRMEIPATEWGSLYNLPEMAQFLKEKVWLTQESLTPRLQNRFSRITLVNKAKTERVTIDSEIRFQHKINGREAEVPGLVIVEVKQDGNQPSDFKRILQEARVQQRGLSKYCLGMLLTDDNIKYNRFKDKIRYVSKLINRTLPIPAMCDYR